MEQLEGAWRKSSYSGTNGGDCVEVAESADTVLVRDTKNRGGPMLAVSAIAWWKFTSAIR